MKDENRDLGITYLCVTTDNRDYQEKRLGSGFAVVFAEGRTHIQYCTPMFCSGTRFPFLFFLSKQLDPTIPSSFPCL